MILFKYLRNKELFIALYFLIFILGLSVWGHNNFYNQFRVLEIFFLLGLALYSYYLKKMFFNKADLLFVIFIILGGFFWNNYQFIVVDFLLFYLLYKNFFFLNYNNLVTKIIVLSSFLIFPIFPISFFDYINTGNYKDWYPMPWNIRVYNSYFLITCIFAVWFYLTEKKYNNIYLVFIFLAFLSILLDAGRSATVAYTVFIFIICIFNYIARYKLIFIYCITWLTYIAVSYLSSLSNLNLRIVRESSSGRYDLWVNAIQCWLKKPIMGCGFYQLDKFQNLSAHPHNLFIQILTETGVIGFSYIVFITCTLLKNIDLNLKKNYFVLAALLAVGIELSFSGIHIYPITQIALLWLFVFLLKNPDFSHSYYFNRLNNDKLSLALSFYFIIIYIAIFCLFIYLFMNSSVLSENLASTPPRFWEYGYKLF